MKLEVKIFGKSMGQLVSDPRSGVAVFEYDLAYRDQSPSPFHLERKVGLLRPSNPIKGLHGCFADSLPDAFGESVMNQWFQQKGINPERISQLERLSYVGDRSIGAISYHPDAGKDDPEYIKDLEKIHLERATRELVSGMIQEIPEEYLRAASSLGGARPKLTIGVDPANPDRVVIGNWRLRPEFEPWILKVDVTSPKRQYGRVEHAYLLMAKQAGIETCSSRLIIRDDGGIPRSHFAVKRFDRDRGMFHFHSLAGLLERDFNLNQTTYKDLFIASKKLTGEISSSKEFLRRGIFNYKVGNCDDHAKNHGFLMNKEGRWKPSPAYDLTPSRGMGRQGLHAMMVADGVGPNPTLLDWIRVAGEIGISSSEVEEIFEQVCEGVSQWDQIALECGIELERRKEIQDLMGPL